MRRFATLIMAVCALLALAAAPQDKAADPSKSQLAKDLIGTWAYAGAPDDVKDPPENGGHYKVFTGKHWCVTSADPGTGKVAYHHGGTYTLDGENLEESVKYATEATASLIGQTFKYKIKVEGDTYTQTGVGNPYNEVWKRAR
jgi:hypothetical protein